MTFVSQLTSPQQFSADCTLIDHRNELLVSGFTVKF